MKKKPNCLTRLTKLLCFIPDPLELGLADMAGVNLWYGSPKDSLLIGQRRIQPNREITFLPQHRESQMSHAGSVPRISRC